VAAVVETPRLAADLGDLLDELLVEVGPSYVRSGEYRNLTAGQAQLLFTLDDAHGSSTLEALARRTQRSVTSAGRLVRHLSRHELVRSREDPGDERARRVELTGSGRAHLRALRADRRERLERYVAAMGAARRLRLAGALHLLSPRLDQDLAHLDDE
jgi:DNA-binding MarR family transcriptional regulator